MKMFINKKIHMIGIGGISMSGIAQLLDSDHIIVTGSNNVENEMTKLLTEKGIKVYLGHHPEVIKDADVVVFTAAIPEDDPELIEARKLKKEIYERSAFLGLLSKSYENVLCISGTHGKSTTTGLLSLIFIKANLDPTIQIGAVLDEIGGNTRIGSHQYLIMEACEYVDSFLQFYPTSEIITNIDNDHLDYFHNLDNIKKSFKKYTELLPQDGYLVINNDDQNTIDLNCQKPITYGIKNNANYMAKNITYNDLGYPSFDIYFNEQFLIRINLNILGIHNIYNSLASFGLANQFIKDIEIIKSGLESYKGVERRFEYIGTYKQNVLIYDDYAHHPTEMETTLNSVKKVKHHESWAIFQSHTYSRTKEHYQAFANILANFDHIIIAPIYGAREINTFNINEDMIVQEIKKKNESVWFIDSFDKIVSFLQDNVQKDDLVITIGAGPINEVGLKILKTDNN